jgi:sulfite reductase alpha subunit
MWPYKFKFKISGCPNDCVASIARADLSIIGTWRDTLRIDQQEVKKYVESGMDVRGVCEKCPTKALTFDSETKRFLLKRKIAPGVCTALMLCLKRSGREKKRALPF